jgi:hypothetical protein
MGRPSKSTAVLKQEQKSNRTKAELKQREEAEAALATGVPLQERQSVKDNPTAHTEFARVDALLTKIGKNDAIYEPVINRYCQLQAECGDFENGIAAYKKQLVKLSQSNMDIAEQLDLSSKTQRTIIDMDKQLQTKRKMLLEIERECGMTVAAAMRSIPKAPPTKTNPLAEALQDND